MNIDIIADVTCPWCFVGLKRLRAALGQRPHLPIHLVWRPFLLNPDLHEGITDRIRYLNKMFGSESRIQQFHEAVDSAGLTSGIPFSANVDFTPSSINAHRLILLASAMGLLEDIAEEIFYAYFVEGRDIADVEVLAYIASENGMDSNDTRDFLNSDEKHDLIFEENARIHRLGINGVPSFVFAGKNVVSGAQEVITLVHILDFSVKMIDLAPDTKPLNVSTQSHGVGVPQSSH